MRLRKEYITSIIDLDDKKLFVILVNFGTGLINHDTLDIVKKIYAEFAPYLKDELQILYVRDSKALTIDGKLIGANCYNRHEVFVALPKWPFKKDEFITTISHEMHHMARHQNSGYGKTLGGAILSEGLASYYESIIGKIPLWGEITYSKQDLTDALSHWDDEKYNHAEWFFKSKRGRWVGYSIGYQISKYIYSDKFDLEDSINILPDDNIRKILNIIAEQSKD